MHDANQQRWSSWLCLLSNVINEHKSNDVIHRKTNTWTGEKLTIVTLFCMFHCCSVYLLKSFLKTVSLLLAKLSFQWFFHLNYSWLMRDITQNLLKSYFECFDFHSNDRSQKGNTEKTWVLKLSQVKLNCKQLCAND